MKTKTDAELVVAVQDGEIAAFEELVRRFQRPLLSFVSRIVRDGHLSQEIVQDALFSLYRTIDRVDTTRKVSTYIFEIAKNAAFSALRKRKYTVSLAQASQVEDDTSIYELLTKDETRKTVKSAVGKLPSKYRTVIQLYYYEELSYEEVSKKLHMPINTVRTLLKRAKAQLYKLIPYEKA